MARSAEGIDYSLILIGKKARDYFTFRNYRVDAFYEGITDTPHYDSAREVAEYVSDQFINGDIDQVILIFTEFVSIGTQKLAEPSSVCHADFATSEKLPIASTPDRSDRCPAS